MESEKILPLLECLSYAIDANKPVEYFLRGILTGNDSAPTGGDPGWVLYQDRIENERTIYHAWTHADVSGLDPCEEDYDETIVKFHIRQTLENFRKAHPDRAKEIEDVIYKYDL